MNNHEPIRSRDNRRLVELRKVRDGRDRTLMFIEGRRLVEEALRSPIVIEECFYDAERIDAGILDRILETNATMHPVASKIFHSIAETESSQGIILTAPKPKYSLDDLLESSKAPIVFLREVNNPSNLGAVLRTAEAAGVSGMIVSKNSADVFSAKALRASMGSAFRMKIVESVDLADAIVWARSNRISSVALDISGTTSYTEIDWSKRRLIIFGSEAHGLSEADLSLIDEKAIILMQNGVESLNLAVSAGIVLFEAKRRLSQRELG